jgi:hypothetical protein
MATPNEDHTFIDGADNLVRVEAFVFHDDLA